MERFAHDRFRVRRYRVERAVSPATSAMPRKRKQAQSISGRSDMPLQVDGNALDVISVRQPDERRQGAVQGSFRVAKARPKFPGKPAPRPHPATSASRFLDQEANETHRRLFGRRDSNPVGGHQQRAALLQMLKRSQGSNIQHRELVPIHPQKDRNILRGQPRKKNFASTSLFPLGDL